MLKPFPVVLAPHDPHWAGEAARLGNELRAALGTLLRDVHHIGSTAIPGIRAKPIIDLIPVAASVESLEAQRDVLERLGYE